jgi:hypothetical protein
MRLFLFLFTALAAVAQATDSYQTPTQQQRLKWVGFATLGAPHIAGGLITGAIATARNRPPEYGPHWDGYFKRQGIRLTNAGTSNLIEAELGALWGEDPRYRRAPKSSVKGRIWYVTKTAFLSPDRKGNLRPAYARFVAIPASNVISNSWRPESERTAGETSTRVGLGFAVRMASNAFIEFWPDVRRLMHGR